MLLELEILDSIEVVGGETAMRRSTIEQLNRSPSRVVPFRRGLTGHGVGGVTMQKDFLFNMQMGGFHDIVLLRRIRMQIKVSIVLRFTDAYCFTSALLDLYFFLDLFQKIFTIVVLCHREISLLSCVNKKTTFFCCRH